MAPLFLTLASLTALTVAVEGLFWVLFRRKMEPLRFPSHNDPEGSHFYYLQKLRVFAIVYTIALLGFVWVFCIILW